MDFPPPPDSETPVEQHHSISAVSSNKLPTMQEQPQQQHQHDVTTTPINHQHHNNGPTTRKQQLIAEVREEIVTADDDTTTAEPQQQPLLQAAANGKQHDDDENDDHHNCPPKPEPSPAKPPANTEPTALSKFEPQAENAEERAKRALIERALADPTTPLSAWQAFATSDYGLINDDLRRQVWPRLVGIDPHIRDPTPSLEQLRHHPEYNQVILDVNRSLKRFPPGIPYEQRIALQDQLTVLILRVILKHPHLRYYQGYHDVAVTFLLVAGDEIAFHVMEHLSTNHLVECMQETMEPTQRRLMFMYPLVRHVRPELAAYVLRSGVGTLFALPWFLTWFGHSLNSYRDVVRLYDYFLARAWLLPIYVTAAIVLFRENEIFAEECDMASMHCVLSRLPEDLPFEYIMRHADELYERWPPEVVELEVEEMVEAEKAQRKLDEEAAALRRRQHAQRREAAVARAAAAAGRHSIFDRIIPFALLTRRSAYVTTAFSIFIGIYAYYYKSHLVATGIS